MFSGDQFGWLAEAQGFLAMCFAVDGVPLPKGKALSGRQSGHSQ